ncbi:hypothetical protein Cfor_06374 [Coptotermes formosanus]|uniref:C-type lectin domain-containing protein n=1 Tax=Coptotermes formosanus TaxID=36987 RepID=A0A6L2PQZ9_COPFO|nr:hypothetical protein Cfor_06374 [Coptotermes formosanus]
MLRGSLCAVVFAVCLYTAQSDPLQPKEDAEQKWSRVSHTYRTLNRVSYYKVYEEPRTWFEASDTCARDGSHLVIINSPDEAAEVKRYLDSTVDTYIIGFHDLFQEGHFQTLQCETLEEAGYTTWAVLEPTSFANEDCGGINQNVQLLDIRCDVEHPFICEHET